MEGGGKGDTVISALNVELSCQFSVASRASLLTLFLISQNKEQNLTRCTYIGSHRWRSDADRWRTAAPAAQSRQNKTCMVVNWLWFSSKRNVWVIKMSLFFFLVPGGVAQAFPPRLMSMYWQIPVCLANHGLGVFYVTLIINICIESN